MISEWVFKVKVRSKLTFTSDLIKVVEKLPQQTNAIESIKVIEEATA